MWMFPEKMRMRNIIGYVGDNKEVITANADAQIIWNTTRDVYIEL